MSSLQYAGSSSSDGKDIASKRTVDTQISNTTGTTTTPNKLMVQASVGTAVQARADKDYVDKQDARFAPSNEYGIKDLNRNIPKTLVGMPNGPVALPSNGKLPLAIFPTATLGTGYVKGPYGWQAVFSPSTTGSTVQVASLVTEPIPAGKLFWPLCFGQIMVVSGDTGGKPLAEIRLGSNSTGMLLATGRGRSKFTGAQGITVLPASDSTGWITSTGAPLTVGMWVSDLNGRPLDTKIGLSAAVGGALYILLAG
jgi:hypothetical protein